MTKTTKVPRKTVETLKETLDKLPEVERKPNQISKRQVIQELRKSILGMIKRGYTYKDVVDQLKSNDFEIQESTLRSYIQTRRKKTKKEIVKKADDISQDTAKDDAKKSRDTSKSTKNDKKDTPIEDTSTGTGDKGSGQFELRKSPKSL